MIVSNKFPQRKSSQYASHQDLESNILKDKEEEHTTQELLATQAIKTLAKENGYNSLDS